MKPQLLKAKTPNKMIPIKGKLIRTPFECIIKSEPELNLLKSILLSQSVKYELIDYVAPVKQDKVVKESPIKEEPISTKKKKPKTTLEKIASETDE